MKPAGLKFDDLSVGQTFETGRFRVTADSIRTFAAEFDPQPMHLDDVAAAEGPFGRLVASGWQTLALTMKLMAEARPLGATPLIGVGVDDIRFLKPVHAETTIFVQAEVIELRPSSKPKRGFVRLQLSVIDEESGEVVLSEIWTVMVPRAADDS